jgi:hypothetical protein
MSKTFNTTTKTKTPYCKVCHDAGRPESEYTSHYVKDQPGTDGKVVCPTLLNQACRICHQKGHTSTYCSRYRPRQPAAEERPRDERPRYIEREERPRRESDRRDISFNRLREDTDRHERDIRVRDDAYNREQDRTLILMDPVFVWNSSRVRFHHPLSPLRLLLPLSSMS